MHLCLVLAQWVVHMFAILPLRSVITMSCLIEAIVFCPVTLTMWRMSSLPHKRYEGQKLVYQSAVASPLEMPESEISSAFFQCLYLASKYGPCYFAGDCASNTSCLIGGRISDQLLNCCAAKDSLLKGNNMLVQKHLCLHLKDLTDTIQ